VRSLLDFLLPSFWFFWLFCFLLLYYSVCLFWTFSLFFPPFPKQQRKKKKEKRFRLVRFRVASFKDCENIGEWCTDPFCQVLLPYSTCQKYWFPTLFVCVFGLCFWLLFVFDGMFRNPKTKTKRLYSRIRRKTLTYSFFSTLRVFCKHTLSTLFLFQLWLLNTLFYTTSFYSKKLSFYTNQFTQGCFTQFCYSCLYKINYSGTPSTNFTRKAF
jgi:hypothetical protein